MTADTVGAQVVMPGGAVVVDETYKGDGATTFKKGDLVRINTSGQIVDAAVDSDTTGPIHGMVLEDWATAPTTSQFVKILQFAKDTIIKMQGYAASGSDAEPRDFTIGATYELRNVGDGIWGVTTTTTKGIAKCVSKPGDTAWFNAIDALDEDSGFICVRFSEANLDAHGA